MLLIGEEREDAQRYAHALASHNAAERCLSHASLCASDMLVSGRTLFESTGILDSFDGRSNDLKGNESKTVTPRHACHFTLRDEL